MPLTKSLLTILYFILLFIAGCSDDLGLTSKLEKANNFRKSGDLMNCIKLLENVVDSNLSETVSQEAQFIIADIYMNDVKNYLFALDKFNKVLQYNIENDVYKKSLFMSAYICSNYLDKYTEAYNKYNLFVKLFPSDELIPSVEYELMHINVFINQTDSLLKTLN